MLIGISSTALKGPFFPWPSSLSSSSSRFLSSASFKAIKRREIHTIKNFRGTILNITILSRNPCSHRSSYHAETSPMEDASIQMTSSYLDLSTLKSKP
ncbi:hypothetical protein Ddye_014356 [Dipteronia dyeriana]|uniref:Uncharacterized protein n=1 Tax=Dipteronia dyeriana TaxID=168575 RepID=A0AAD9X847_9ROSI|nr:hypothetical protein Ddye_014356 [Dipteronia dyeriana]